MREPFDRLIHTLDAEAAALERLGLLLEDKSRAMLASDPGALAVVLQRLEPSLRQLTTLEREREQALQAIGAALGPEFAALTVTRLSALTPQIADRLQARRQRLREAAAAVVSVNTRNARIARTAMDLLTRLKSSLMAAIAPPDTTTYGPGAKTGTPPPAPRLLDRQA